MPKNTKRCKNAKVKGIIDEGNSEIPLAKEDQEYAIVTKMLGGRRLLAKCNTNPSKLVHIPSAFKGRKYWICVDMLVLLNIRSYQQDRSDVIYIYSSKEAKNLQNRGLLNDLLKENKKFDFGTELESQNIDLDNVFNFEDV